MMRAFGLSWIQRVRTSPSSSRSLAFVAVNTLAPIMAALLGTEVARSRRELRPGARHDRCGQSTYPGLAFAVKEISARVRSSASFKVTEYAALTRILRGVLVHSPI